MNDTHNRKDEADHLSTRGSSRSDGDTRTAVSRRGDGRSVKKLAARTVLARALGSAIMGLAAGAPAKPKHHVTKLATLGILAFVAALALGLGHPGSARADFGGLDTTGTGSPCSLKNVSVTKKPDETLYVYEADCPGYPLGFFGGNVTSRYQVIGNWNPATRTARDNLFWFNLNQGVFETWTCNDDPWITTTLYGNESGWPNGHTCQLQNRRGGDDWTTDTNPPDSWGYVMCFNDPWGVNLAKCWSNDQLWPGGPSAAIWMAWSVAQPQG